MNTWSGRIRELALTGILLGFHWHANAFVEANSASIDDLTSIKGIGPATAQRIVEARHQQRFDHWQDFVSRVKGIGEKRARQFSDNGLRVGGIALGTASPAAAQRSKPTQRLITIVPRTPQEQRLTNPFVHQD